MPNRASAASPRPARGSGAVCSVVTYLAVFFAGALSTRWIQAGHASFAAPIIRLRGAHELLDTLGLDAGNDDSSSGGGCSSNSSSAVVDDATFRRWRQQRDEEPIHVAMVICADDIPAQDEGFHGLVALKSLLIARAVGSSKRRRYHLHIVVDDGWWRLQRPMHKVQQFENWDVLAYVANYTGGRVNITWYNKDAVIADTVAAVGEKRAAALDNKLFKQCSSIRLRLPFVRGPLADVANLIYIDMDSIVKCDLETMWEEEVAKLTDAGATTVAPADDAAGAGASAATARGSSGARRGSAAAAVGSEAIFGFSEEAAWPLYPTAYNKGPVYPDAPRLPTKYFTGLNAGIFTANLARWRAVAQDYWDDVVDIVRTDGYKAFNLSVDGQGGLTYGDQDILNLLTLRHPGWFIDLPVGYNWRSAHKDLSGGHLLRHLPKGTRVALAPSCIEHYAAGSSYS
jgi:hypothetical protein